MLRAITLFCVISEEDADIIHLYSISAEHDPSVHKKNDGKVKNDRFARGIFLVLFYNI